ncbi:hypothetical protein WR25_12724 [Diploscapter pachys]|uniref:BTB domain-containing protein n=1 Tax=Diploscapter pachys TaxID=2018661 RepID=A0A2A2LLB9_9BILA|nr:hypothetical protein WR25_12724 [Diploscapter pachys]
MNIEMEYFGPPIRDSEDANGSLLMGSELGEDDRDNKERGDSRGTDRRSPQRGTPLGETAIAVPSLYNHPYSPVIIINVSGLRFETYESTLSRYPNTLLGSPDKRRRYFRPQTNEYFFDRHRTTFESILYIYQSRGKVKRPEAIPIDVFLREMRFFEMGQELLEEFWIGEGYEKPGETLMPKNETQRKLWELIEYPDSSVAARVVAFVSIAVIVISIVSFCWETVPSSLDPRLLSNDSLLSSLPEKPETSYSTPFFWIELGCIVWFTIELLLRLASCPSKLTFMASFLNIIDFVAIAPFFVNLMLSEENKSNSSMSFAVLRVLRLVRVFRIFKLSRHSVGLQILGKTFRASVQEFILLIFFMGIALVLFASGMYFAEQGEHNSKFTSIPASFWFVLVTMTTVGYGDLVPLSPQGKIVGSMCALIGVLTLALPVPIIVANFKHFYRQENRLATMRSIGKEDDNYDDS